MRRWLLVAAAAALVVAIGVWWLIGSRPEGGGVVLAARGETSAPQLAAPAASAPLRAPIQPAKQGRIQREADKAWCKLPVPQRSDTDPPRTTRELHEAREASAANQALVQAMDQLRTDWTARLRQRGDERSQALADLLQGDDASLRHLETLANTSSDPVVYAWAFGVCSRRSDCTLSAARWAQLDPGNLVPWEWQAARARAAGDPQAQGDAVFRIAGSTRSDSYQRERLNLLLSLSDADGAGMQMAAENWLISTTAWRDFMPQMQGVTSQCVRPRALADPAQASVCTAAAEAMWKTSDNLLQSQLAVALGLQTAPQDKQRWVLRVSELAKLRTRDRVAASKEPEGSPCDQLPAERRRLQALATSGELGALRLQQQTVKSID
jgi:hypothetical protein